ncbi:MAG TPA: hypothetical protein PKN75_02515 [Bacteroidia bacterium]|nr:hypothetical protein [Bacteroidia bacterium]HNU32438.1 hypothetical protein [Bacteroidia bacterium]
MNKLEEIVSGLNKFEVNAFKSYLLSSYFTTDKSFDKLFNAVHKQCTVKKKFDAKAAYIQTYGKPYNNKKWRYAQSFLCKHLEYFLSLRYLNSNKLLYHNILLSSLAAKNFVKAWHFTHNEIVNDKTGKNANFFLMQFQSAENSLEFLAASQSRKKKFDYQTVLHHFDVFFITKKLQLACEVINLKNIIKTEVDINFMEEVVQLAATERFKVIPVVQIYLHIYLTLTKPSDEKFFLQLKELIKRQGSTFPLKELNEFYQYAKNYCIKKINSGNAAYNKALFEIYIEILGNKKLLYHEWMSQFEFKNIVTVALREGEILWCKNFIERYITFVKPAEQKNALAYNSAYYLFSTQKFKDAIRKLADVEFTDIAYQVDSRVILLKCYYELQDADAYFYHASAFRLFLLRNRYLSEFQKTFNRNLIIYLSALFRAYGNKVKIEKLKNRILKEKNVADISWLMEKIEVAD